MRPDPLGRTPIGGAHPQCVAGLSRSRRVDRTIDAANLVCGPRRCPMKHKG